MKSFLRKMRRVRAQRIAEESRLQNAEYIDRMKRVETFGSTTYSVDDAERAAKAGQ